MSFTLLHVCIIIVGTAIPPIFELFLRLLSHSFGRKGQTNMKDIINNNEGIYFYESS